MLPMASKSLTIPMPLKRRLVKKEILHSKFSSKTNKVPRITERKTGIRRDDEKV